MLKSLFFNNRSVPVPVPLRNLRDALGWIESTLLQQGASITRISLDGLDLSERETLNLQQLEQSLSKHSCLRVQADSPLRLRAESLDVVQGLCTAINRTLEMTAVECWKSSP